MAAICIGRKLTLYLLPSLQDARRGASPTTPARRTIPNDALSRLGKAQAT